MFSDAINTVSRKYAEEIQTPEYGFGLDGLLRETARRPERDSEWGRLWALEPRGRRLSSRPLFIRAIRPANANANGHCLAEIGLPERMIDRPLLGIVSRFATQKGFDLIGEVRQTFSKAMFVWWRWVMVKVAMKKLFQALQRDFSRKGRS